LFAEAAFFLGLNDLARISHQAKIAKAISPGTILLSMASVNGSTTIHHDSAAESFGKIRINIVP
jgi:hypothetical protein